MITSAIEPAAKPIDQAKSSTDISLAGIAAGLASVARSPTWTPLVTMSFPGEKNAQFRGNTPLGRPGQPGELAPLYVFLVRDESATSAAR